MGIHGNSTCVMNYDGATGYLVGEPEKGLAAMFIMMNAARLGVGLQGLAQGEVAYQNAVAYAKDRRQGRALVPASASPTPRPTPIRPPGRAPHADGGQGLQRGARALSCGARSRSTSAARRRRGGAREADDLHRLLTPVIKGYLTDKGFEAAVNASRSMAATATSANGAWSSSSATPASPRSTKAPTASRRWTWSAASSPRTAAARSRPCSARRRGIAEAKARRRSGRLAGALERALGDLQAATMWLMQNGMANPNNAGAGAYPYMTLMGIVALGLMWLRMAKASARRWRTAPRTRLPRSQARHRPPGSETIMALPVEAF
jgi:alkylation response protein AidB-like acyl-CoA dehydrogenase